MTMETEFSLADLAGIDVSGVEEVRFELLPMGLYEFEVTEAEMSEGTNGDGDKRFEAKITLKVLECITALEAGVDKESLAGKTISERNFINTTKTQKEIMEAIGRVKATVVDMGGEWSSNIIENVENLKGNTFRAKVTHQTDKTDKSIKYARIKFDQKK